MNVRRVLRLLRAAAWLLAVAGLAALDALLLSLLARTWLWLP